MPTVVRTRSRIERSLHIQDRGLGETAQHLVDRRDRAVDAAGHRGGGQRGVKMEMRSPGFVDVDRNAPACATRRCRPDRMGPRSTRG